MTKSHTITRCDKDNLFGHRWFVLIIDGEGRNANLDNWYCTRTYIGAKLLVILHKANNRSNQ